MKKNFLFAIGLLSAMVGVVGCSDSELSSPDYSTPAENAIAFTCTSSWGEGNEVIWTDQTQIGLFCEQSKSENEALSVTALTSNQPEGTFYTKTAWGKGEYSFFLYAPYNKNNTTTSLSGIVPAVQSQSGVSTNYINNNALLYAAVKSSESKTPVDVAFNQVLNYLDIAVSTEKLIDWSVESIKIEAPEGTNLVGSYTFDLATEIFTLGADKSNIVTLNTSGATLSAADFHFYMIAAPFATTAAVECKATVTAAKDGETTKELSGKLMLPSGVSAHEVVAIAVDLDTYEEAELEDTSIDLCDPTGSGTAVTANCYIAGAPGQTYRFDATVMGNGYTTPATADYAATGTAAGITPTALAPKSAKLLWQTAPTLISKVKLSQNQVYFTLNGTLEGADLTEGNAVIAVYSGENATGDILWSWHIWVTAADLDAALKTYTLPETYAAAGNPLVMDRNLGALKSGMWGANSNNLALGLMYQWGRKDPFPNIDDTTIGGTAALAITLLRKSYNAAGELLDVSNTATSATPFEADKWLYFSGKMIPKADIAKYPMNFGYDAGTTNWIDEACDDLWGNPYTEQIGEIGHKSIYDPCPAGYRVPHRYFATTATSDGANAAIGSANVTHKDKNAFQAAGGNSFAGLDFPAGGMMFVSGGKIVPFRTGIYVAHYQVTMPAANAKNSYRFYLDYGNVKPADNNARYVAGSVRCMKEK